jgi:hypothetical protein
MSGDVSKGGKPTGIAVRGLVKLWFIYVWSVEKKTFCLNNGSDAKKEFYLLMMACREYLMIYREPVFLTFEYLAPLSSSHPLSRQ